MKKNMFLTVIVFLVLLTSVSKSCDEEYMIGVVKGLDRDGDGFLSMRDKPNGREIMKLFNGDTVDIYNERNGWYNIQFKDKIGWAYGKWIKIKRNYSYQDGVVSGLNRYGDGFLAFRDKPNGKRIMKLFNGDRVTVIYEKNGWYKIIFKGNVGWASSKWIVLR